MGQPWHQIAPDYIRRNYQPDDRVALMLIHRNPPPDANPWELRRQIVVPAKDLTENPDWSGYLRAKNAAGFDVNISMNTIRSGSNTRHLGDIDQIRHAFLDFDKGGLRGVQAMLKSGRVPHPHEIVNTSKDHYQVHWRVQDFTPTRSDELMRGMVREFGADPAAVDISRVMRLPGLYNRKYDPPQFISVQTMEKSRVWSPDDFPQYQPEQTMGRVPGYERAQHTGSRTDGQDMSAQDFGWACQQLEKGRQAWDVEAELFARSGRKNNPADYAHRTVDKAFHKVSGAGRIPARAATMAKSDNQPELSRGV